MISWAAINKIVERKRASDPKYREQLAGRPLRSDAKLLTDEELLAKLRSFGVELDQTALERLCENSLSAEEITEHLVKQCVFKTKQEELESDWIWICLTDLWRRWFPDKPCFELLDDKIQDGYELLESGNEEAACSLWLDAWSDVQCIFDKTGMHTIKEFDQRFRGSEFLCNWLQDLEMELWNAGLEDRPFLITARISLCEEILLKFFPAKTGKDHDDTTGNWRRALAESYFEIGETGKAESLYREWLENDPRWGWGWIGWSDCYFFGQPSAEDLARSEQLLRQGLAIVDVRDRLDLMERLAGVCDEQGRSEQAQELREQIRDGQKGKRDFRSASMFGQSIASEELPLISKTASAPWAATANNQKVGRKEPCPCGSGKKFKRCCDSGRQ